MDLVAPACIPILRLQGNASHYQCNYSVFSSWFLIPVFARLFYEGNGCGLCDCGLTWLLKTYVIAVVDTVKF